MVTLFPKSLHKTSNLQNPHRTSIQNIYYSRFSNLFFLFRCLALQAISQVGFGIPRFGSKPAEFLNILDVKSGETNPMTDPWDWYIYQHLPDFYGTCM